MLTPSPDAQSLSRFLATAGVLLCLGAFIVPGVVLRDTGVLQVSSKELGGLTPTARSEIQRRQRVSRAAALAAPYVGGLLFLIGLGSIAIAVPRLRQQEGVSDALSSAELGRLLRDQVPSDRTETLVREVQEQVTSSTVEAQLRDVMAGGRELSRDEDVVDQGDEGSLSARPELVGRVRQLEEIQQLVLDRIVELRPRRYEVRAQARLGGSPPVFIDALLVSDVETQPDVIVEIKATFTDGDVLLQRSIDQALGVLARYRSRTGRSASAWIVIVVPRRAASAGRVGDLAHDVRDVQLSVVTRDAIDGLELPGALAGP